MISFFKNLSFKAFKTNKSILIYYKKEKNNITMINIYINDFLLAFIH